MSEQDKKPDTPEKREIIDTLTATELAQALLTKINDDPFGTEKLVDRLRSAGFHARMHQSRPAEYPLITSIEKGKTSQANVEEQGQIGQKAFDEMTELGVKIDEMTNPDELLDRLVQTRGWKNDPATKSYVKQAIKHAKRRGSEMTEENSGQRTEGIPNPETTPQYWAEKLRRSGEYDIRMSSFDHDWLIGGKRLGDIYPNAPMHGELFTDGTQLKLGSETTYRVATDIAKNRDAAALVTTPRFAAGFVRWNAPSENDTFSDRYGREMHQRAIQLFGFPDDKNTKFLSYEETRILNVNGIKKGTTWKDYSEDRGKTYFCYRHPLANLDRGSRAGNALSLVFGLLGPDTDVFIDLVKKDPSLLDGLVDELYPGLCSKDQVRRVKIKELIIATVATAYGMGEYPTRKVERVQGAKQFMATRENPYGYYERFDEIKIDPPIGE